MVCFVSSIYGGALCPFFLDNCPKETNTLLLNWIVVWGKWTYLDMCMRVCVGSIDCDPRNVINLPGMCSAGELSRLLSTLRKFEIWRDLLKIHWVISRSAEQKVVLLVVTWMHFHADSKYGTQKSEFDHFWEIFKKFACRLLQSTPAWRGLLH